jgi:MFS family permease
MPDSRGALWGWLSALVSSYLGSRLSMIALPWFVLSTTGSATMTGLVAAAELAPYVLAKVLAGPIIDRVGPRRVAVPADLLAAVPVAAVPALAALGMLTTPVLLGLVAMIGLLRGPADVAKVVMAPSVATAAAAPLERVTGLAGVVERLATTIGGAAAALLIGLLGAPQTLLATGALFVVSALVVMALPAAAVGNVGPSEQGGGSYLRELSEGWRFLRAEPVLMTIVVVVGLMNFLDQAAIVVLIPVWSQDGGHGAQAVGLVLAAVSAGAVAGSAMAAAIGHRIPRLPVLATALVIGGAPRFWVLASTDSVAMVCAVMVLSGFAGGFLNPLIGALKFERTPRSLIGRVPSLMTASAWALMPLGAAVGGLAVSAAGVTITLAAAGALYLAITLAPLAVPAFRALDRARAV